MSCLSGATAGKKTAIIAVTVVHVDALLIKVMKRTDFKTKRYKALIEEPNQTDLWEKCRSIYLDPENRKTSEQRRRKLYLEHKSEMDEGAVVLWPESSAAVEIDALVVG
ncbi:hypothetical protein P7H17_16545 [Paenibacillus larvae]|nr:hypothetical protein [Paenibacillus larvae]MDT2287317.1 hypothetical protein [Paenibacillus larvae]